jgi:peptidoglycan/LPS O-acetylase OafA/YrhL
MQGIFRFLLAMMVLWSHSLATFFPEAKALMGYLQLGNAAVSVFFVLSGFLMAQAVSRWYWHRPLNFIANRYVRITPPLLVAAFVAVIAHFSVAKVGSLSTSLEEIPITGLTLNNVVREFFAPLFPLNGVAGKLVGLSGDNYLQFVRYSWAIYTEILFYWILFGFVVCARALRSVALATGLFLAIGILITICGVLANYPFLLPGVAGRFRSLPFAFHLQWAPHFLIGVLTFFCVQAEWSNARLNKMLLAFMSTALAQIWLYGSHGGQSPVGLAIAYSVTVACAIAIMLSARYEYRLGSMVIGRREDRAVGDLSYPIYINQFSLSLIFLNLLYFLGVDLSQSSVIARFFLWLGFNAAMIVGAKILIAITDVATVGVRNQLRGAAI